MKRASAGPTKVTDASRAALERLLNGSREEADAARAMLSRLDSLGPPGKGKGRPWFEAALIFARALIAERDRVPHAGDTGNGAERCYASGKVIFGSEAAAKRSMRSKSARLRAYRCPDCLGWHLTKRT